MPKMPAGEGVLGAIQAALQKEDTVVVDDRESDTYAGTDVKKDQPAEADTNWDKVIDSCPHCGWDLKLDDPTEVDADDKMVFIQSIMGNKRFVKTYELLGGGLHITFRTLTTKEMDLIYAQLNYEQNRGEVASMDDYYEKLMRYRMCLSVMKFDAGEGGIVEEYPEVDSFDTPVDTGDDKENTKLFYMLKFFYDKVITSESISRMLGKVLAKFNRLVGETGGEHSHAGFLERDREVALVVKAAASGAIDFREADFLDPRWWNRFHILIKEFERSQYRELHRLLHMQSCVFATTPDLSDDGYKSCMEGAVEAFDNIVDLLLPWREDMEARRNQDDIRSARELWVNQWGDPDDPEVAEKIKRTAEALAANTQGG